jgi:3-oxoacyl-[acyl-carrier protein] reductase
MKSGRTILIAGSRRGIGRALAGHYADRGHAVIGLSRGEADLVHEGYRHIVCDVTDEKRVQEVFDEIAPQGQATDVVIYCAGLKIDSYALLTGGGQAESMLRTNLLGAFLVTRQAARLMKRHRFGRFVYLTSIAVPLGSAGTVMYGASKAGLEQMAFALSREFPKDNITFNCLGISVYPSTMVEEIDEKSLEAARKLLVKPDALQVEEIAGAVDFFASDAARQITGQTLYFGGVR